MNSNSAAAIAPAVACAEPEYAAFVSLDWADEQHAWALQVHGQADIQQGTLKNTPEAVEQWGNNWPSVLTGVAWRWHWVSVR